MASSSASVSQPAAPSPVQKLSFGCLLCFIYAYNSRVLDFTVPFLHLPLLLGIIAVIGALLGGGWFTTFTSRTGVLYLALTCYFALGAPFSYWRGGSVAVLRGWVRTVIVWALIVGLTVTCRTCKSLLNTIFFASATAAALGLVAGKTMEGGRLSLAGGQFDNPNYFAAGLLIGLPFAWRLYSGRPGVWHRGVAVGLGGTIFLGILKSGSRAALVALAAMFLLAILRAPLIQKILLVSSAGILFVAVFAAMPNYLRERFLTLADPQAQPQDDQSSEPDLTASAAGSTRERKALLMRSISITLNHPLLGVGVGQFSAYVFDEDKRLGVPKEPYLGTHNSYTQLSSEAGIPALLIFLGILVISWRRLGRLIHAARRDLRPEAQDVYRTALAVQACLAGLYTFFFFFHMAYEVFPHIIIGVALVASSTGESELKRLGLQQPRPSENTSAAPQLQASTDPRRVIRDSTLRSR